MKIVMLGAPGAGKGTQAIRLAEEFGIPHVSTGDIFRKNIKEGTELGRKAQDFISKGALVPDDITIGMLLDRIAEADCAKGYILDGFPRTLIQAENLKAALDALNDKLDYAVDIVVPDEVITDRMSGRRICPRCGASYHTVFNPPAAGGICDHCGSQLIQREDDKAETVQERLATYHKLTQPLEDYYKAAGILMSVDGTKDPDEVFTLIKEGLK